MTKCHRLSFTEYTYSSFVIKNKPSKLPLAVKIRLMLKYIRPNKATLILPGHYYDNQTK
jgi:hypothetical protein